MTDHEHDTPMDVFYQDHCWSINTHDFQLEAMGARLVRTIVRCTLTVRRGEQLLYRDTVNLTTERARARLVRALQAKGVTLDDTLLDTLLLALDEAIRQTPRDRRPSPAQIIITDPPVEFDGTVPTIADLEAQVHRWLRLKDTDVFRLMLAAVAGHRMGGESPWLLIVGPPSSVKTELLRMLSRTAGTVRLSSLTARTFASGLDTPGAEPSLLQRLTNHVLVLKDFTTVLELAHDERQGVLAQLREIHDGQFDKFWGTGKELHWEGHVGFLAGVTPVIDQHHAVMGLLGPRFLLLRLHYSEDERPAVARRALRLATRKAELRRELAEDTAILLAHLPTKGPDLDPAVQDWLVDLANLVTHARSPVSRARGGTLQYAPEPEVPARFALQLYALAQGLVVVAGGTVLTTADQRRLARVAWDGIPVLRRTVLHVLAHANGPLTPRTIATMVQFQRTTVRRTLEDLQALKLISCAKGGAGIADGWTLRPRWRAPLVDLLQRLHKVPQPAGTKANAGGPERQETSPERSGLPVRRAHVDARQVGRSATRRRDGGERRPPA